MRRNVLYVPAIASKEPKFSLWLGLIGGGSVVWRGIEGCENVQLCLRLNRDMLSALRRTYSIVKYENFLDLEYRTHPPYHRTNYYPRLGMSIVSVLELSSLQQVGGDLLLDSIDVAKLWAAGCIAMVLHPW